MFNIQFPMKFQNVKTRRFWALDISLKIRNWVFDIIDAKRICRNKTSVFPL